VCEVNEVTRRASERIPKVLGEASQIERIVAEYVRST
jgi:hypothetical protein